MVLAELGGKLRESLRRLQSKDLVTQDEVNKLLADIARALIEADVNVKYVMQMRESVKEKVMPLLENERTNVQKLVQKAVVDELTSLMNPGTKAFQPRKGKSNVVLFVGLQGAGKTTSIAKYANYYQRRGWKVCMICADTFRAGAFDQLKQNSTKLRIPFYGSYTEADPVIIAQEGVEQFRKGRYEIIIVDTSGRHKQQSALFEEMQEISASIQPNETILVMDATQGQAVYDQALAFHHAVEVGSVIVTKLDGHAKGGGAISAVAVTNAPISFLGTGEHFDDLDPFVAQSFVSKLLGFGDMRGLAEALKTVNDKKSQEEMMKRMEKGVFTLRDMYSQLEKVMSLGPMNKLMGMMPGVPEYLIPKGNDTQATDRLRRFMIIMDSMSNAELDGKVNLHKKYDNVTEQRIRRIAAGSGSHPTEVKMLLIVHKQFETMTHRMAKSGMVGKGAQQKQAQLMAQMKKNPALMQQRLNQMDPKVLQQMGGRDTVMQMMQNMSQGGGGAGQPDMDAMAAMMGGGMPGMGGGMPNVGGDMPNMGGMDMETLMKMAQSMGMQPPR